MTVEQGSLGNSGGGKHVAVLLGGWSAEREVSLVSGAGVVEALRGRGYRVTAVDVSHDLPALVHALTTPRPDVVFNALHGRGGEDGIIQGVLEVLAIPYTHSGVRASALAMDKSLTNRLLATVGVPVADAIVATADQVRGSHLLPPPYVVKPVDEGSSVGVRLVHPGEDPPALEAGGRLMVERYIPGRELTVGVMGDRALAVTEIKPTAGTWFDYDAKYTSGGAVHDCPASLPEDVTDACLRLALLAHRTLGCSGISRSDFRWDETEAGTGGLYFLEINTQPGFTPVSLFPEQAAHCGLSYADVCVWLVEGARCHG